MGSDRTRLLAALRRLQVHDHLCLIYSTREEQFAAVAPFIQIGLERGEKCVYIADENSAADVLAAMKDAGIDVDAHVKSGALTIAGKQDAYLMQGYFDPDLMIEFLKEATDGAKRAGYTALRVTGEMTWVLGGDPGTERLIEYESKLNRFFPANDCLAICQYNRDKFSAETILDVIKTHPLVIYKEFVCANHNYIPTEEFLAEAEPKKEVERLLANLVALQESRDENERLQAVVRFMPLIVVTLSPDHKIIGLNDAAQRLYQCDCKNVIGCDYLQDFVAPAAQPTFADRLEKALAGETPSAFECPVIGPDGAERIFRWHITRLLPVDEIPAGVVAVGEDVTKSKRAEEELMSSENKYRNLFETMTQGVLYLNAEHRITAANPAASRILGLPVDQMIGQTPYDPRWRAIHEDGSDWPMDDGPVAEALRTGRPVRNAVMGVIIPEKGIYHWININAMPQFRQGEKRPYQVYATFEDITERKQAEREVREGKELLEKTFASLQEAVFVIDPETRKIESCNSAAAKMFGYSADEMIGRATDFLHVNKEMFEEFGRDLKPQLETTGAFQCEWQMRRRNGEVFDSEHTVTLIRENGRGRGVVSVVRDITERKKRTDELRARAAQQAAVAELGSRALAGKEMGELVNDAVVLVKEELDVDLCKVLELLPDGHALLLKAGVGWHEGLVGRATVGSGKDSQAGYTLLSDKPVIVEDWRKETRFQGPKILRDHNVASGISVVIRGPDQKPYGVMGAHSTRRRAFTNEDANFLQAMANTISTALARAKAEAEIRNERDKALQSEANFRAVTETSGAAIFIIQGTKFSYQNRAAEALTGYSPKEIERLDFWDIVHPDFQELVKTRGAARLKGEKVPSRYEFKIIGKSGEEHWLDYSGTIINFEGRPAILGTAIDVTEKKQAQEAENRRALDIRQAYVDVLSAVTGGRLIITTSAEIEAVLGRSLVKPVTVTSTADISEAKDVGKKIVQDELPGKDIFGIMVAVVEALTNAVKHGGGGRLGFYGTDGKVQIVIEDSGPGIDFSLLPKATLGPGFSTKQSLGMGFGIMLEECDRVMLATEPGRTIVVLEKSRRAEEKRRRTAVA